MKIQRRKRFAAEVSTSSLNDIMFFLLLFFLIISTLANPNVIKIMLPKTKTAEIDQQKHLVISINENKSYYVDNRAVLPAELERELISYAQREPNPAVVLRLSSNLNVQDMVDVMSICSKNKIKIVLATQKVN